MRSLFFAFTLILCSTVVALAFPLVVGSAIGLALFNVGISITSAAALYAIGYVALTAASIGLQILLAGNKSKTRPDVIKNTVQSSEGQGRYAFGRVEVAGRLGFANTKGYSIYRLLLHSFGELDAIEDYVYDGREIIVDSSGNVVSPPWVKAGGSYMNIQTKIGDGTETAWSDLTTDFPTLWTSAHKVQGIFQTLLKVTNPGTSSDKFAKLLTGGVKELTVVARVGKFYDPRDVSTDWSMNGVLHTLHWMKQLPGITASILDQAAIGVVATAAEVSVATLTGTAPRCQLSGGWEGVLTTDIVEDMLTSAGLEVNLTNAGIYTFAFIEDNPSSEITITSNHIIDRDYKAGPEGVQRPNICKLDFFSPERRYELAEIDLTGASWAKNTDEITKYGEQEFRVTLPFCTDPSQAQRIARRLFHMARADFGTIVTKYAGVALWGVRTATIEIPDVGVDGASVFVKCRLGTVRVNDADGTCEVPFQVIPDELTVAWNAAAMEQPAPPVLSLSQYEAALETPVAPSGAITVQYPDSSYEGRVILTEVAGAASAEAVYRTYTAGDPNPWQSITEIGLTRAWVAGTLIGVTADFRVRFIDVNDDSSHFSNSYSITTATIDNTALAAPTLAVTGAHGDWDAEVTLASDLNVASVKVQYRKYSGAPSGSWIDVDARNARPYDNYSAEVNFGSVDPEVLAIRAMAYTSDGTGTSSVESIHPGEAP